MFYDFHRLKSMDKNVRNMIIAFMGAFIVSLYGNTFPPFLTTIQNTYHVSDSTIATVPLFIYGSSFLITILGFKIMVKLDLKKSLYVGLLFAVVSAVMIFISNSFYLLLVGYIFSGLSVGLCLLVTGTIISVLPVKYQKFSFYNACYGFSGIIIMPIAKLFLEKNIRFQYIYLIHILIVGCYLIFSLYIKDVSIHAEEDSNEGKAASLIYILKNPLVLTLSIAVFLYVGAEMSTTNWSGAFLERYYSMNKADVPNILSSFWVVFTIGRTIGDKLLDKIGRLRFLIASPILTIFGILIILSKVNTYCAILGIVILGITMSLVFPALQGYIVQHVPKSDIASASTIVFIFDNLGATFMTYLIGLAAQVKITYVFTIQIGLYLYIVLVSLWYLIKSKKSN